MSVTWRRSPKPTIIIWRLSGDHLGIPYSPSGRRSEPSAFINQMPFLAPSAFERNAMRSSAGENEGQLPAPRSVTDRPAGAELDRLEPAQGELRPGRGIEEDATAVMRPGRRAAADQAGRRLIGDRRHVSAGRVHQVDRESIRRRPGPGGMLLELVDEAADRLGRTARRRPRLRRRGLRRPGHLCHHRPRRGQGGPQHRDDLPPTPDTHQRAAPRKGITRAHRHLKPPKILGSCRRARRLLHERQLERPGEADSIKESTLQAARSLAA